MPSPKAARIGLVALGEPFLQQDARVARTGPTSIMLEVSNKVGDLHYRPKDYIFIPRGHILGLLKVSKKM